MAQFPRDVTLNHILKLCLQIAMSSGPCPGQLALRSKDDEQTQCLECE